MQVTLTKFADRVTITLDSGQLTNKIISYELRNRDLVYVIYCSPYKFKTFLLTDPLRIARHLNKIERKFNIIFNQEEV